jgi:hypothetical protein
LNEISSRSRFESGLRIFRLPAPQAAQVLQRFGKTLKQSEPAARLLHRKTHRAAQRLRSINK